MERRKSKGPRLVRRQKWSEKLVSAPWDFLLSLNEDFELIDWDSKSRSVGLPLAVVANILLMICHYFWPISNKNVDLFSSNVTLPKSVNDRSGGFFPRLKSSSGTTRSALTFVVTTTALTLMILSMLNVVYIYTRRKRYYLLARPSESAPCTPSANKVVYNDPSMVPVSPLKTILNSVIHGSPQKSATNSDEPNKVWQLQIWDPPLFNTYFASGFSPLHLFVIWYIPFSLAKLILLIALSGYLYVITNLFFTLLKDRSIINTETMNEYSKKLVQPVVAASRKDVCVGTEDDTARFYSPSQNTTFITRDVRPSRIKHSLSHTNLSPYASPYIKASPYTSSPFGGSPTRSPTRPGMQLQSPSVDRLRHHASVNSFRLSKSKSVSGIGSTSTQASSSGSETSSRGSRLRSSHWRTDGDSAFN